MFMFITTDGLAVIKYLSETINKVRNEDRSGANEALEMAKKAFQTWIGGSTNAGMAECTGMFTASNVV